MLMCTVDLPEDCWGWKGDNGTSQTYFLKHLPTSPLRRQPLPAPHSPWAVFCLISQLQPPVSNRLRQISYQIWPFLCPSLAPPTDPRIPQDSLSLPNPLLQSSLGGGPSACPSLHVQLVTLGPAPTRAQTMDPILLVCSPDTPAKPGSTHPEFFHTHVLPFAWNAPSYPSSGSSSSAAAPQEPSQLAWLKAASGLSFPLGILWYA